MRALLASHDVRRQFAAQPEAALHELHTATLPDAPTGPYPAAAPAVAKTEILARATTQLAQWQEQVAGHLANEQFGPAELARLLDLSERTLYRRLG